MKCERVKELFSECLEGGSDHALIAEARGHINECPSCGQEFNLFRQTWYMLDTLPEVEPPASFRHDVVMRAARMQHERTRSARQGVFEINWQVLFGRTFPVRTLAVACASVLLAMILLKVPTSVYQVAMGVFNPGARIVQPMEQPVPTSLANASSLDEYEADRKNQWMQRTVQRNTLWVTVMRKSGEDRAGLYRVKMAINPDALLAGETTARIGVRVYWLPANEFSLEAAETTGPVWEGNVLKGSPVVMPVIVDQSPSNGSSVNILVRYQFRGRKFSQIIFLPNQTSSGGGMYSFPTAGVGLGQSDTSLYPMLQSISSEYGVPVIANGRLREKPSAVDIGSSTLTETLRKALRPVGLDWLSADGAVYVDWEYDVE